jgi:ubiquinone/menaquinone biosynthesis C-methylase UbiE
MSLEHLEPIRLYELDKVLSLVSELKTEKKNLIILEVGAGTGWQAKKLNENGYTVKAIDIEDSDYSDNRIWPITNYDGKRIPFTDNYFDIVFSSNVLEHISHLDEFQIEMQRVLKSDGIAIHIVPSGSWRLWTNIAHYPFIFKMVIKIIYNRIIPVSDGKSDATLENSAIARYSKLPKMELFRKTIFPSRHGEIGTSLSEVYYFSRHSWGAIFRRGGWKIKRAVPNRLFYTCYMIFGSGLCIQLRKYMSYFLGSSCHIFVLEKKITSS